MIFYVFTVLIFLFIFSYIIRTRGASVTMSSEVILSLGVQPLPDVNNWGSLLLSRWLKDSHNWKIIWLRKARLSTELLRHDQWQSFYHVKSDEAITKMFVHLLSEQKLLLRCSFTSSQSRSHHRSCNLCVLSFNINLMINTM